MSGRPRQIVGRPPKLTPWQISYAKRAQKLRRALSVAAVAAKFGVSESTVNNATSEAWTCHHDEARRYG